MTLNLPYWLNKGYSDYPSCHSLYEAPLDSMFTLPGFVDIAEEWRQKNAAYWRGWNIAKNNKQLHH